MAIVIIDAPSIGTFKFIKQMVKELDSNTVIVINFIPLSTMVRSSKHKIHWDPMDLNNTLEQMNITQHTHTEQTHTNNIVPSNRRICILSKDTENIL